MFPAAVKDKILGLVMNAKAAAAGGGGSVRVWNFIFTVVKPQRRLGPPFFFFIGPQQCHI